MYQVSTVQNFDTKMWCYKIIKLGYDPKLQKEVRTVIFKSEYKYKSLLLANDAGQIKLQKIKK